MLLMHQTGSLKIGEVIRYTITYIPSQDPTVDSSSVLYLRIKNTCYSALRAAFMRGPYNLSVAAYPATYNPNEEFKDAESLGIPSFEPYLRASGAWDCTLKIPNWLGKTNSSRKDSSSIKNGVENMAEYVSWIVEVSSQVVFSASAEVHYEVLLGKNQNCLSLNTSLMAKSPSSRHHSVQDRTRLTHHQKIDHELTTQTRGVFSNSIKLKVEDTAMLWSKPSLSDNYSNDQYSRKVSESKTNSADSNPEERAGGTHKSEKISKIHLVVLTHGLHSNIGADMLYLKESIDAAIIQAKVNAREIRRQRKEQIKRESEKNNNDVNQFEENKVSETCKVTRQRSLNQICESSEDEEEVVVRGFSGNVARTERGIKYLGKRLARYVLSITFPKQQFQQVPKKRLSQAISSNKRPKPPRATEALTNKTSGDNGKAYHFTSISFIGHSLGGLVQTYAVAYIQKHWPSFFDQIRPINFIALATPFLGLSNENPSYIKFALDFGFIGRTGQDLGLSWSAPTMARNSFGAIFGQRTEESFKSSDHDGENKPENKPLLQILPMGPAHTALKKFKSRTVYSNVVNDGIVPLRTSCLLFIDWQCLGKVEKAKRENNLMGKLVEWGWAEITGATSSILSPSVPVLSVTQSNECHEKITQCPSPCIKAKTSDDNVVPENRVFSTFMKRIHTSKSPTNDNLCPIESKKTRIYQRSQTVPSITPDMSITSTDLQPLFAPPQTSVFESAGDLLVPPLPTVEYLLNFSSRPQIIFHDRIYHPWDIPHPVQEKKDYMKLSPQTLGTPSDNISGSRSPNSLPCIDSEKSKFESPRNVSSSNMKIEEKIARAYHRDLSWRKVLVRIEPDAHNNIIVRRMFANAYGWPVVKHLCDTHFSESAIYSSCHDSFKPPLDDTSKNQRFYNDFYNDFDIDSNDKDEPTPNFEAEPEA
ncbi:putative lipase [Erysiphe necator]|nr:putative lipase [Erysiphe necator]